MGFHTYILEAAPPPPQSTDQPSTSEVEKAYFIIDRIYIQYVTDNDKENINLVVTLNSYNSYEERLLRGDILMTQQFTIPDLIDKNFSENLWTKCYIKIKELVLNQITEDLKKVLASKESEGEGDTTSESINTDPNTGIETDNIVDTIPAEYQYLLEIDDHFN